MTRPKRQRGKGTFGGTYDQRRGYRDAHPDDLRRADLGQRSPAAQYASITPPSRDALLRSIEAQRCPWCGRGPFKMLPVHTNKAHGVDKWELRELAGLSTSDSLVSEEVRDALRAAALRNGNVQRAIEASRVKRGPRRQTTAGRQRNVASLQNWEAEHPDESTEARKHAGKAGAEARWRGRPPTHGGSVRDMARSGYADRAHPPVAQLPASGSSGEPVAVGQYFGTTRSQPVLEMLALQALGTLVAGVGYHRHDDGVTEFGLLLGFVALAALPIAWVIGA